MNDTNEYTCETCGTKTGPEHGVGFVYAFGRVRSCSVCRPDIFQEQGFEPILTTHELTSELIPVA